MAKWTDQQLIDALREAADKVPHGLLANDFRAMPSMPSIDTIMRRIGNGSWVNACIAAGIREATDVRPRKHKYNEQDQIDALRRVNEQLGRCPSIMAYRESGELPCSTFIARGIGGGSWRKACEVAGLNANSIGYPSGRQNSRSNQLWRDLDEMTDDEFDVLLSEMWTEYREGQEDDLTDFQKEGNRW